MGHVTDSLEEAIQLMKDIGVLYDDKFFSKEYFGHHVEKNDYFEAGGWLLYNQDEGKIPVKSGTMLEVVFEDGSGDTCDVDLWCWLAPDEGSFMKYRKPQAGDDHKKSGNKYTRTMKGIEFDAYDVIEACEIKCPALQHAAKKVLYTGVRGHKDEEQDLQDIIDSAHRAMELYKDRIKYNKENK